MNDHDNGKIAILQSQLDDEYRRNGELREQLARLSDVQAGPTCAHCRKPVKRDGDGNWRCREFLIWCGIGDSKHAVTATSADLRATQIVTMRREP